MDIQDFPASVVVARAARALAALAAAPKSADALAETLRWADPLANVADSMASASAKRRGNKGNAAGRAPTTYYVDHEQNGPVVAFGAKAVAALLGCTETAVNAAMSKGGGRMARTVTEDGREWVVSVRRATEAEEAAAREDLA